MSLHSREKQRLQMRGSKGEARGVSSLHLDVGREGTQTPEEGLPSTEAGRGVMPEPPLREARAP